MPHHHEHIHPTCPSKSSFNKLFHFELHETSKQVSTDFDLKCLHSIFTSIGYCISTFVVHTGDSGGPHWSVESGQPGKICYRASRQLAKQIAAWQTVLIYILMWQASAPGLMISLWRQEMMLQWCVLRTFQAVLLRPWMLIELVVTGALCLVIF
eukprot:evm.model.scf_716.3 EVM.evm.TU.scf_716.3   scf_716:15868-17053(+)